MIISIPEPEKYAAAEAPALRNYCIDQPQSLRTFYRSPTIRRKIISKISLERASPQFDLLLSPPSAPSSLKLARNNREEIISSNFPLDRF